MTYHGGNQLISQKNLACVTELVWSMTGWLCNGLANSIIWPTRFSVYDALCLEEAAAIDRVMIQKHGYSVFLLAYIKMDVKHQVEQDCLAEKKGTGG